MVKGHSQLVGVDYGDTFAPVARLDTIKLLVAFASQFGLEIYHLYVKSALLNSILEEHIYIINHKALNKE